MVAAPIGWGDAMGYDVFISYSSRDKKVADAACARLEQAGHRCWIAPRDVHGGEWGKSIIEGINGARVFVLIFSAQANCSPQVNREVERAVSKGLPIIPYRIEDVAPSDSLEYFISNQHWLDALTPPRARHLTRLAEMVGHLLDGGVAADAAAMSEPERSRPPKWWVMGIAAAIVLTAASGWLLLSRYRTAVPIVQSQPAPAPKVAPLPTAAAPTAPAVTSQDEDLLDFTTVSLKPSDFGIPGEFAPTSAEPLLRNAPIRVRIVEFSPPSYRLFFLNSRSQRLAGVGISGPDRNLLFYGSRDAVLPIAIRPLGTPAPPPVPYSLVLEFEEPVAKVDFELLSFRTSPSVRILAYGSSGGRLDEAVYDSITSPARHIVELTAWSGEGIRRVSFEPIRFHESDFANMILVIQAIRIRRMVRR
jgi:hypothetical protein